MKLNPPTSEHKGFDDQVVNRQAKLIIHRASDIKPEPIRWLWPEYIAIGKQSLIAGEPGLGKSQMACWIAAAVTTGGYWPGTSEQTGEGSVIMLSAEDDAADTIRPRLDAAGADAQRVYIISAVRAENGKGRRGFNLQQDLRLLEAEIARIGDVRLVIIDPVSSYLGQVDSHRNAELRAVLEPISEMASRLGVAVISVTHLNKGDRSSANNRIIGSIGFVAVARAAFLVARDPDDKERGLLLPTKTNVAVERPGIGFRIEATQTSSGIIAPRVCWDDKPVHTSADEVLANHADKTEAAPARAEAEDFLLTVLSAGPKPSEQIKAEAMEAGLSWRTIRRAKDRIGAKAKKIDFEGPWVWELPKGGQT